jgi:hypothetical protein
MDGDLTSVAVTWHGEPSFAEPHSLFSGLRRGTGLTVFARALAASRDGSRIFWILGSDQAESNVIHIKTCAIRRLTLHRNLHRRNPERQFHKGFCSLSWPRDFLVLQT